MKTSQQEIIVNHSANDLYKIVLDIEKYPEFIPWCHSIKINSKSRNEIFADMIVKHKLFFPQKFTSHVIYNSKKLLIHTNYIDGPLKNLKTKWFFKKINLKKTKILFNLEFEFKNVFHQKIAEFFFNVIENKMIDSFRKRADQILN